MSVHVSVPAILEPPENGGSSLAPQHKNKPCVVPGFHRTKHEDAIAGIAFDGINVSKRSVYGPGFYMTRTFAGQNLDKMRDRYGKHIIRCEVDVTGFVCFDRAMARRVWGQNHTLQDQLQGFDGWTQVDKLIIEEWSKILDAVWVRKAKKEKPNKNKKTRCSVSDRRCT